MAPPAKEKISKRDMIFTNIAFLVLAIAENGKQSHTMDTGNMKSIRRKAEIMFLRLRKIIFCCRNCLKNQNLSCLCRMSRKNEKIGVKGMGQQYHAGLSLCFKTGLRDSAILPPAWSGQPVP